MDKPLPVIIDCDPGQDDAVALALAFSAPEIFEILGVTTVAGNVPPKKFGVFLWIMFYKLITFRKAATAACNATTLVLESAAAIWTCGKIF